MRFLSLLNHQTEPQALTVETNSSFQIPSFQIVGLPSTEVLEARERVKAAIDSSGFEFPKRRIVVNLAPSGVRKGGTWLDLPIALAILSSEEDRLSGPTVFAVGELGLEGKLRGGGLLLRAWSAAWKAGAEILICPKSEQKRESDTLKLLLSAMPYSNPLPTPLFVSSLQEAREKLEMGVRAPTIPKDKPSLELTQDPEFNPEDLLPLTPLHERTLLLTLIGGHSFLWLGPKGIGKSQAFHWARALQPPTDPKTRLEQAWISELAGGEPPVRIHREVGTQVKPAGLMGSVSASGLIRAGELSLAHGGILFADEFPEWPRDSRECLRGPLESGQLRLSRAAGRLEIPARFQLLANGNLCPCGAWGSFQKTLKCRCRAFERKSYLARLSGPILDRIDGVLKLRTPGNAEATLSIEMTQEKVKTLRNRIDRARNRALQRFGALPALLPTREVEPWLKNFDYRFASLRSRHRVGRVALSIALLDGLLEPALHHLQEAASLRPESQGILDA